MKIQIMNSLSYVGILLASACSSAPMAGADAAIDVSEADAAIDTSFSGLLSLADDTISNPGANLQRGFAALEFINPASIHHAPEPGYESNVGACRIFVYDVAKGQAPPAKADGGPVTIHGTNFGEIVCAFDTSHYRCSSTAPEARGIIEKAGSSATANSNEDAGTANIQIAGANFAGSVNFVGMHITLAGFEDNDANGTFPIVGLGATADTLVIANTKLSGTTTLSSAGSYQTFVGAGLVPYDGIRGSNAPGIDFLNNDGNGIGFTKSEIPDVPAIDTTISANGFGFALSAESTLPHALPTDGSEATFSCAGSCGVANGIIKGIVVFGATTDGDTSGPKFHEMPDPVSRYATFQCAGTNRESITLDSGAMALLLGTNPTRIETTVRYANASLNGKNTFLASHGVVGWTDVE